jgi:SAM-dependent methyltransferase
VNEPARCPVCGTQEGASSWSVFEKDGFDLVRCPVCGLLFRRFAPSTAELRTLYGAGYFSQAAGDSGGQGYADYLADEEVHRANARRRLELLERFVRPGRLLDVGCAAGFFLHEAGKRGWQPRGVDVSVPMSGWGRRELGVDIHTGLFGSVDVDPVTLDAITMWDYIEHSTDPAADIEKSASLLRPGGVLAISTGDVDSLAARIFRRRWHLLTPRHHVFFFSERTLRLLLARAGLAVVWLGWPASIYPLRYLIYKARTMGDLSVVRALARRLERNRLGSLTVPLSLRDIITVIARKPKTTTQS